MYFKCYYMSNSGILSTPDGTGASIEVNSSNIIDVNGTFKFDYGFIGIRSQIAEEKKLEELMLSGGINDENSGAFLSLKTNTDTSLPGGFVLGAKNNTPENMYRIVGHTNGECHWCNIALGILGYPAQSYIDLELGSSGSSITAPFSGWFEFSTLEGLYIQLYNKSTANLWSQCHSRETLDHLVAMLPCSAGDIIQYYYDINSVRSFRLHLNKHHDLYK